VSVPLTLPASLDELLVDGIGQLLASEVTEFAWRPSTADATKIGLYSSKLPTTTLPAVALSPYPLASDPGTTETTVGLQFWIRGTDDDRSTWRIDRAIARRLLGRYPLQLANGLLIVRPAGTPSGGSLGQDANRNWLRSANYPLVVLDVTPFRF
jgi:hypothetical protein